jgi:hypothetical protein
VRLLPFWFLISLGCYALFCIGKDLLLLNDCTEASDELNKQIKAARVGLEARGYKFE